MCGIYGVWNLDGAPLDAVSVRRAVDSLRHRGPDDSGFLWADSRSGRCRSCGDRDTDPRLVLPPVESIDTRSEAFNLALGFRRLAIIDLSPAGHQPMSSADERHWIVFNGEVYNYRELRSELSGYGHTFRTNSDTEVVLAAYRQWGPACLSRFNGMWGLAVWDRRERRLFLARDRFGVKPLYHTDEDGRFAFASEMKALVGRHGRPFQTEDGAIYRYLVEGRLPDPMGGRTFFRGIRSVPPGHWLMMQADGRLTLERYYDLACPGAPRRAGDQDSIVAGYRELLTDAVRLRLRSDVPVGTCLSGGIDSSAIACLINRLIAGQGVATDQIGRRQKTFSAVYETEAPYNERAFVEKVLTATGAEENFTFPRYERLREDAEKLIWHQDEPFGSTSLFAQWCVMSKARERGVKVLLDGQGADEALAGYGPYDIFLSDLIRHGRWATALKEASRIRRTAGEAPRNLRLRALTLSLPQTALRRLLRRRYRDRAVLNSDFAARLEKEAGDGEDPVSVRPDFSEHLRDLVRRSSLPHLLRFEDRNSMAFGVEARVPFVDYRLMEYAFAAAASWRIHRGWTKWVLRQAMRGIVPEEVIWRRDKVGFATPERDWLGRWLGTEPDLFRRGARSGEYLDLDAVNRRIGQDVGNRKDKFQVWRWINLELWLKLWG